MTTLVTGAAGYVAGHTIKALRRGFPGRLVGVVRRPLSEQLQADELLVADLRELRAVRAVVEAVRPRVVFHLAGRVAGDLRDLRAANVDTTRVLLEALRLTGCDARIVVVGSAAEYGNVPQADQPVVETHEESPTGAYGIAKLEATKLALRAAREFGQWVAVARPFNIIGPGVPSTLVSGAIVNRLRMASRSPRPGSIRIGRTTAVRDFVAVEDVAVGLMRIAEAGKAGEVYNLCSGVGHSVAELLAILMQLAGDGITVDYDPALLRPVDVDRLVGDNTKARTKLGWRPTITFESSVRASWFE